MLQLKKKWREGGLLKITTSNINSAQCFQVLLLWRLHPTAGVSNDRGSQLCFPLRVFSCCCLSSVAPPHTLEHMCVSASDTRMNRTNPVVGGGGVVNELSTKSHQWDTISRKEPGSILQPCWGGVMQGDDGGPPDCVNAIALQAEWSYWPL